MAAGRRRGQLSGAGMEHVHALSAIPAGNTLGVVFLPLVALALLLYLCGLWWQRAGHKPWPLRRTLCWVSGLTLVALACLPLLSDLAHRDLRAHMLQHLLLGMFAPLALVLGAPLSLLLRSLPRAGARRCLRLLGSPPLRLLTSPWLALLLNVGGMYLLYLSPLFGAMASSTALHLLVHLHFLLAGYLYCWTILDGPDPLPGRAGPWQRLGALGLGIAAHAVLGKWLYAGPWPKGWPAEEAEAAAQWMYYGGDLAELLLLAVLFAGWRRKRLTGLFSAAPPARRGGGQAGAAPAT